MIKSSKGRRFETELRTWPSWTLGLISGPLVAILLALLIQLVVPALARKLVVLVSALTCTKRELVTQDFYFTFLFVELVLLTAVSSTAVEIMPYIIDKKYQGSLQHGTAALQVDRKRKACPLPHKTLGRDFPD